jgi:molybdopterin molybdotransferase
LWALRRIDPGAQAPHYTFSDRIWRKAMTQSVIQKHPEAFQAIHPALEKRRSTPEFNKGLLEYQEALFICLSAVEEALSTEVVALEQSLGRVLRQDQVCPVHVPPWHRAMMDGYAVKAGDVCRASFQGPVTLAQIDEVPAGRMSSKKLGHGETIRIMTGACVPEGADAVIKVEVTRKTGDRVEFFEPVGENPYIIAKGQDLAPGDIAAKFGNLITPAMMGVLSACGTCQVTVSRKPAIAIIPTGSELATPGQAIRSDQIYDINSLSLFGLCLTAGANPVNAGIVQDRSGDLLTALNQHLDKDIILLTGGVSVGDYDIVHETLLKAGVEEIFWRVKVQPGKPLFFGKRGKTLIFGLPGNPVSSFVNFHLFVRPVIDKLLGKCRWGNEVVSARVTNNRILKPGRRKFLRGQTRWTHTRLEVEVLPEQRSGVFSPMLKTDALIEVPGDVQLLKSGEIVNIHLLRSPS